MTGTGQKAGVEVGDAIEVDEERLDAGKRR